MENVTPSHYIVLSLCLFSVGFLGVLLRRNLLLLLMSLELMLNGINLALVTFSRSSLNLDGSIFVFFIMTVAGIVAVGLAILVALFKRRRSVFSEDMNVITN